MTFHDPTRHRSVSPRLRQLAIALVLIGVLLRVIPIEHRFFWGDEVLTALRISGYSELTVVEDQYTGQPIRPSTLQQYQTPAKTPGWGHTIQVLTDHPEHPPLYYALNRVWTRLWMLFGSRPILAIRSLSAVLSVAVLPIAFWLMWDAFGATAAWTAIALLSVSPLHVLYAQDARQYSLWILLTVLSSWLLVRAVRTSETQLPITRSLPPVAKRSWLGYTIAIALGLYTHLLFSLVMMSQGMYVLARDSWRIKAIGQYGRSVAIAVLLWLPWLWVLVSRFDRVQDAVEKAQSDRALADWLEDILRISNRVFFNADLTMANGVLMLVIAVALIGLWQQSQPERWLILMLVLIPAIALIVPDVLTGSTQSTRVRYMIPVFLGIQLAIALWFADGLRSSQRWRSHCWRFGWAIFLVGSVAGSLVGVSQTDVPWVNSGKAQDYLAIADRIRQSDHTQIISDTSPVRAIALSHELDDSVRFYLIAPSRDRLQDFSPARLDNQATQVNPKFPDWNTIEAAWVFDASDNLRQRLGELGMLRSQVNGDDLQLWEWRNDAAAMDTAMDTMGRDRLDGRGHHHSLQQSGAKSLLD
jgi:uncharacterized membrane protein